MINTISKHETVNKNTITRSKNSWVDKMCFSQKGVFRRVSARASHESTQLRNVFDSSFEFCLRL